MYRVFVSSTWEDLQPERRQVKIVLDRLDTLHFVGMENFGSTADPARNTSLDYVDGCDIYVGIIGFRYGSGITEDEYNRARERGLLLLLYLKDGASSASGVQRPLPPDDPYNLAAFKARIRRDHIVSTFDSPHDLSERVVTDIFKQWPRYSRWDRRLGRLLIARRTVAATLGAVAVLLVLLGTLILVNPNMVPVIDGDAIAPAGFGVAPAVQPTVAPSVPPPASTFAGATPDPSPPLPSPTVSLAQAKIVFPPSGSTDGHKIEARGAASNVPDGSSLWIVVLVNGSYWPQDKVPSPTAEWAMTLALGDDATPNGTVFEIQALVADAAASAAWERAHTNPGYLKAYPAQTQMLDSVRVRFLGPVRAASPVPSPSPSPRPV
jgi:hypothetical protein